MQTGERLPLRPSGRSCRPTAIGSRRGRWWIRTREQSSGGPAEGAADAWAGCPAGHRARRTGCDTSCSRCTRRPVLLVLVLLMLVVLLLVLERLWLRMRMQPVIRSAADSCAARRKRIDADAAEDRYRGRNGCSRPSGSGARVTRIARDQLLHNRLARKRVG